MSLGEMKNKWLRHLLIAFHPKALTTCWILAGLLAYLVVNAFPFIQEQWLKSVNKCILAMHEDYSCGDSYGINFFKDSPYSLLISQGCTPCENQKSVTNIIKKH